jgi:RNA-splicing ligase RtcB
MPITITDTLVSWATDLDANAREQALRTSRLPVLAGPVALMPDAHWGIGATVGSVVATDNTILPSAVGVDIGCGMVAAETSLTSSHLPDDLTRLHGLLRDRIPAGVGKGHDRGEGSEPPQLAGLGLPPGSEGDLSARQRQKIVAQFGSLGSGNHFCEVCLDERDRVWVVLHSGSRGIGKELAERHIKTAKLVAREEHQKLEDQNLAWLTEGRPEFDAYVADMLWAQRYAWENRNQMMDAALAALRRVVHSSMEVYRINCHHNYATRETHLGREVWITRKGAIRARAGDLGVIPGSMAASSFIVRGAGNPLSYESCSHGAGRRLGRRQAKEQFTGASLRIAMAGKAWDETMAADLVDEHPDAYKDIRQVMADQDDLVEVVHELHQILNLKGT